VSGHRVILASLDPYVWLDATYVKVREAGRVVSMAVLVATGVAATGAGSTAPATPRTSSPLDPEHGGLGRPDGLRASCACVLRAVYLPAHNR
jgi:hypothetical protein